jgi:major membrane immunogen (membrane-anchored lipoprotein)
MRIGLTTAIVSSLALTACGDSDSAERTTASSPATARREVRETRDALTQALATYKNGDKAGAREQVAEAYVSHFEEVEGPLDTRDHELNEELEHAISDDLRADMKAGKPAAAIEAEVKAIVADLDKAEAALQ